MNEGSPESGSVACHVRANPNRLCGRSVRCGTRSDDPLRKLSVFNDSDSHVKKGCGRFLFSMAHEEKEGCL